jgi:hypothetical protein
MKPLSTSEKEKILSRLFWDVEMNQMDLEKLIDEKIQTIEDIQSQQFFSKLLTSCDWYTLMRLMPPSKLKMILREPILERLFPKNLKLKYTYARDILSRRSISDSGQNS